MLISEMPLHEIIRRALRRRIESGELGEGSQLPSEAMLQREFRASRTPVRQALKRLQNEGIIVRAQGRGSFVASAKMGVALRDMTGFSQELRRQGHVVESRTLEIGDEEPPADVARILNISRRVATFTRRLLIVDGAPLAVFEHWLSELIEPSAVRTVDQFGSLYALLEAHGIEPWYGTETIGAAGATTAQAELLDCAAGDPLLTMRRLSRDPERRPIEHATYCVRADRYEYQVNLVRQRP